MGHTRTRIEGWILCGTLDGAATIDPSTPMGGLGYLTRLACDLAYTGIRDISIVWTGSGPVPDVSSIASDPRLVDRATIRIVTVPTAGESGDGIVIVRGDRVCHRDTTKHVLDAWSRSRARLAKLAGEAHDGIVVADRATALILLARAREPGGFAAEIARLAVGRTLVLANPPYLAFTAIVSDAASVRAAERLLVSSLRKSADGIAAKLINRHISLPVSRLLAPTRVHPNHVTLAALLCALAGALAISRGGYAWGVLGLLGVELGSIIDGVDGELARLRYQFSKVGQWLDTVVDDVANIAYLLGVIASLRAAGLSWAAPFGLVAIGAFVCTQVTQYTLIATVYRSGDLAAIPWAFQSSEFLSRRATGVTQWLRYTVPKMLKRDFVVTLCLVLALLDRLDLILLLVGSGMGVFFAVFWIQFARHAARGHVKNSPRPAFGD